MKRKNVHNARWYLCECARPSCREEFYLPVMEYVRASLGSGTRMVIPEHRPPGAAVLARWDGVVMIQKEKR